ncbi:hypothetical protein G3T36_00915 [Diaminobutyricibacter tongyongensis]|uniref:Uncharacterized protein n=1 Tax=Leifsonia tongyongensis TaxID=1268043 RepID=A0A6L9XSN9_9MICO|nr:hypothetical protein [Diaminobutyricibacter tongyongensis]NEN04422.1 hypothetical protein [Diaminobutyricibacter tongyongensis]
MARPTSADLLRRIEELEAENAALRMREDGVTTVQIESLPPVQVKKKGRGWGWTLLATVLIVIGAILAPVAVVASWAKVVLTDSDTFVATYAPLAKDPAVQAYITNQIVDVINQQVDVKQLTNDVIDGITSLGTGPAATKALEALKGPAAQGIQSLVHTAVGNFVSSPAFADVWTSALRLSHEQLVATMQNNPKAAITIGSDGSIGIQLAPIIERVKSTLVSQGITFASQIPTIDRTITVAQSDAIPTIQAAYNVALLAGAWLPWVALAFLAAGVLVARRRAVALIWAAVALALSMIVVAAAFAIGRIVFISSTSPALLPSSVARTLFNTVVAAMQETTVAVLVLAIVVAVVGWFAGPFEVPRKLRGFYASGAARLRTLSEEHGISTGRFGEWLYAQRVLLRVLVAVIASAIVLFVRPITPSLTIWTLVIAVLVIAILELLQRPVVTVPREVDEDTPIVTAG